MSPNADGRNVIVAIRTGKAGAHQLLFRFTDNRPAGRFAVRTVALAALAAGVAVSSPPIAHATVATGVRASALPLNGPGGGQVGGQSRNGNGTANVTNTVANTVANQYGVQSLSQSLGYQSNVQMNICRRGRPCWVRQRIVQYTGRR